MQNGTIVFRPILTRVILSRNNFFLLPDFEVQKQTHWSLCLKAIHVVSLTTDLMAVCRSSRHTNCANLHILNKLCKTALNFIPLHKLSTESLTGTGIFFLRQEKLFAEYSTRIRPFAERTFPWLPQFVKTNFSLDLNTVVFVFTPAPMLHYQVANNSVAQNHKQ